MPIEKYENGKTIKYNIRFIDSVRFVASTLSSLIDNLAEVLHKDQCKNCKSNLEYMTVKDSLIVNIQVSGLQKNLSGKV